MAIDYKRAFEAAVNAAFNEDHANAPDTPGRKSGSGMKAVVAGAALVATARFAAKRVHLPDLGELSDRAGDFADRARDRLGLLDDEEDYEDYEDEDYDEPEDEADVEEEDEPDDDDEDEDLEQDEEPEDEADLDEDEDLPPDERIDPASRPPRPPKRQKSKA